MADVENVEEGALAAEDSDLWCFPETFCAYIGKMIFSGPDAARLYSMAVLIAKQDRPQKLHSVLVLHHVTTGLEVSWSESGISTLAQWLLEHPALAVMGMCVSKHWTESLVTTADVSLLLRTCSLVDSHRLLLVLVWRAGKEPRPGYKCFSLRKDRVGMVLDSTRHEPEDFLVPAVVLQESFHIISDRKGAPLKTDATVLAPRS